MILITTAGEKLMIIHPGIYNTHQGPDFNQGALGSEIWVGDIQLHVDASDWHRHQHSNDKKYRNVILHVVWKNDDVDPNRYSDTYSGSRVPKISASAIFFLDERRLFIPCESSAGSAGDLVWTGWKERLMIQRLERKSTQVLELLQEK